MQYWLSRTSVRVITLVVVILSLMAISARAISSSHDPFALALAEMQRHVDLPLTASDHGHTHALGLEEERQAGHLHGHNSFDHTHEVQNLPPEISQSLGSLSRVWRPAPYPPAPQARNFRIDRPPKIAHSS